MTRIERLQAQGIRRLGTAKRGFRYARPQGRGITRADRERIEALRIPPAWADVAISPSATASLQAIGKDAAGRWQYRYHPSHVRRQDERKYRRLVEFGDALPAMRRAVARDLAAPGLSREKVLAGVLWILSNCFIRPGSRAYADEHGSYGIATIRRKHVTVKGDLIRFDFPGKSGTRQYREVRDRRIARLIRACSKVPGHEVFKWRNGDGSVTDVRRRHINAYIKELMGRKFSAKDFRTWAGTLICACALARTGATATDSKTTRKKKIVAAVKETAEQLGNTPATCRSSYIYPSVLSSFERGRVIAQHFDTVDDLVRRRVPGLHRSETALLTLLRGPAR